MRGKQAAAANARRNWAAIEQERDAALLRAAKAEAELASAMERSVNNLAAMERELDALRIAASDATAPVVERLRTEVERLRGERETARTDAERIADRWGKTVERVVALLATSMKISRHQAMELLVGAHVVLDHRLVDRVNRGELSHEQVAAIDHAQYGDHKSRSTANAALAAIRSGEIA